MNILGRYIAKKFILYVVLVYILCIVLIFLIDFVEMLRITGKFGGASTALTAKITLLRIPIFAELIFPFAILIGGIGTFLMLSRSSELIIVRATGMSVWQFLWPVSIVAMITGFMMNWGYNPLAAAARAESERIFAKTFKRSSSLFKSSGSGIWLRQKGEDGSSIITAKAAANGGLLLNGVTIFQYDKNENLSERIEARQARLNFSRWELLDVLVSTVGRAPQTYKKYVISTKLTPTQVKDSLGSVESVSFLELPKFIKRAEDAGLPAKRYRIQYQSLLSRPALFVTMVLIAATSSLGAFRFGNVQKMLLVGMGSGFVFFLFVEVSKNLASADIVSPITAAWLPCLIASLIATTVLLGQEDG